MAVAVAVEDVANMVAADIKTAVASAAVAMRRRKPSWKAKATNGIGIYIHIISKEGHVVFGNK